MSHEVEEEGTEGVEYRLPLEPGLRVYSNRSGGVTIEEADNVDVIRIAVSRARLPWLIQRLTELNATLAEWYAEEDSDNTVSQSAAGGHHV